MVLLNQFTLQSEDVTLFQSVHNAPIQVLQIGEGNFLRGFVDWMLHVCAQQGLFQGSVAVMKPRPGGEAVLAKLAAQDGLYTLVTRGLEHGQQVSRKETISVFSNVFNPYENWQSFKELAAGPELKIVVSNTTEAGLKYEPVPLDDQPIVSFPGKVAYLLWCRYEAFQGAADAGLVFLPCELLERNGDVLRQCVLQYADDWGLPEAFKAWVTAHNRFLNSLVDRIVTGYPDEAQAEAWFEEWGYRDTMLCTAEPYHLWAIEADAEMEKLLPFRTAGLNVHWATDLTPFQQRKVRLLNGAHTWMAPLGILHGIDYVGELIQHPDLGTRARTAAYEEIIPTLPYPQEEMERYTNDVFERFANPYIKHRLSDIAMNSLSKFRVRLLPSIAWYVEQGLAVPEQLTFALAGLIRYYRILRNEDGSFTGTNFAGASYTVRDNAIELARMADIWQEANAAGETIATTVHRLLAEEMFWGQSLAAWESVIPQIVSLLTTWEMVVKS